MDEDQRLRNLIAESLGGNQSEWTKYVDTFIEAKMPIAAMCRVLKELGHNIAPQSVSEWLRRHRFEETNYLKGRKKTPSVNSKIGLDTASSSVNVVFAAESGSISTASLESSLPALQSPVGEEVKVGEVTRSDIVESQSAASSNQSDTSWNKNQVVAKMLTKIDSFVEVQANSMRKRKEVK